MATIILIPGRKESFANYSGAVEAAGGQVVFSEDPACLPAFDGLLLPGGGDVEPWRYGMENTASRDMDPRRDALEFAVLEQALTAGVPVLGICRGPRSSILPWAGRCGRTCPVTAARKEWTAFTTHGVSLLF